MRRSIFCIVLLYGLLIACGQDDGDEGEGEAVEEPQEGDEAGAGSEPRRPFSQQVAYAAGTIRPDHVSQQEMDQIVRDFYGAWKETHIADDCGEGRYYVLTTSATGAGEDTITVSEAHGYGMIITALMAGHDPEAQTIFDGLYRYFRDHPAYGNPDLMAWNQVGGCEDVEPGNTGTATDGDMDIAYALLLADAQWGSDGAIDYRGEALTVIEAILESEVNPETATLLLGNWANSGEPDTYYATRSSDFMPGHLRAFGRASGDESLRDVLDTTYDLVAQMQAEYSPETGLLPDFIVGLDGDPRPADAFFLEGEFDGWYYYNACRDPWRIGVDYLLSGDERALAAVEPINAFIIETTGGDPASIPAGYALDGTTTDELDYTDLAFIAPFAVSAMAGPENQAWLNALWDFIVAQPPDELSYYDRTLTLLSLIVLSGGWWEP